MFDFIIASIFYLSTVFPIGCLFFLFYNLQQ